MPRPKGLVSDSDGRLNEFFKLRVSTNLLISQFLEMAHDASQGSEADGKLDSYQSFISTQCASPFGRPRSHLDTYFG